MRAAPDECALGETCERRNDGRATDSRTYRTARRGRARLWEREARGEGSDDERARLDALKVTLDQCWDLLRQRRALDAAGLNPEAAQVRDAEVVERYQQ